MKKLWIILLISIVVIIGVMVGLILNKETSIEKNQIAENIVRKISEKIEDECTEEYEIYEKNMQLETNSGEEKISPNCLLILRKHYTECDHTTNEYVKIPNKLVNKTKDSIKEEYPNWEIEKYSSTEIILYKELDSDCGEHFILKDDYGKITVYIMTADNEAILYKKTEIPVEYLPENDKIQIEKGIRVNGKEELNEILENFE